MFRRPGRSWQLSVDAPEDLHLALYVRDASGLTFSDSVGPLRDPPRPAGSIPATERPEADQAWRAWWAGLLVAHRETSGDPPAGSTTLQAMAWRYEQRQAAAGPPEFTGLAAALRSNAVQAWRDGFRRWWEIPPSAEAPPTRSGVPLGGVRGRLLNAILASSRTHQVHHVVQRLERAMRRQLEPFELTIDVLDVHGEAATMVSPRYALVPVGLYTDAVRYPDWLYQTLAPLA